MLFCFRCGVEVSSKEHLAHKLCFYSWFDPEDGTFYGVPGFHPFSNGGLIVVGINSEDDYPVRISI